MAEITTISAAIFDLRVSGILFLRTDSLGELIQRTFPETKVVKTLNTVNCEVMVNPALVPGDHDIFICGNDAGAKARVLEILKQQFGWRSVTDLGDISAARATEQMMPIWMRLYSALGTAHFNFRVVGASLSSPK